MTKMRLFFAIAIMTAASMAYGFAPLDGFSSQSISIPYYDNIGTQMALLTDISQNDPAWQNFQAEHGAWWAKINTLTGQIHRAWGGSVYVGQPGDADQASEMALSFLGSVPRLLNLDLASLRPTYVEHHGHHWFVEFAQTYNGIEIYGSKVSVRISDAGNVVLFGCDYYPHVNVSINPMISSTSAISAASLDISFNSNTRTSDPELVILPIPNETGFEYHLAYKVEVNTDQPGRWLALVDADNGSLLYRKDMIYYYSAIGYINGRILPTTPYDTLVTMAFPDERVILAVPETSYTDTMGFFNFEYPNQQDYRLTAILRGRYVNVLNYQGVEASYIDTVSPGDTVNILWDTNARRDERNAYYHTNIIHSYTKTIDPSFTSLDFSLTCNVNMNQTCNAYWDGSSINFFMAGGGCQNTGEIADVIYHEYGHGVTEYMYRPDGPTGAQHEGWSDYVAAAITNQPLIGRGFYGEGSHLRTVDNNFRWPEDTTGESHNDGQIIAGALWHMRQGLAPRTAYADSLFHYSRYGHSHNFEDYLIDILEYDDDDDNLYNGTPNSDTIYAAFDRHGIGPGNHIVISHVPLNDTEDEASPYNVIAMVGSTISPLIPDSVMMHYRLQSMGQFISINMAATGNPNEFLAAIPAQHAGTLVEYYISADNESGLHVTSPTAAPMTTYFFVVGRPTVRVADSLETDMGWAVGSPDDDARTGIWARVDPVGTHRDNYPDVPYQPEDDHTPDPGAICFITGQQPVGDTNNSRNDVDSGQTTVYSPLYNMSGYTNPIMEVWRWFANSTNLNDTLYIDVTDDGMATWHNMEMVYGMQNSWVKSRFLLSQFIDNFNQVRFRFIAEDRSPNSIVEAGIDDIKILSVETAGLPPDPPGNIPAVFALKENYPNPFNARTEIRFDLPARGDVQFNVYDIAGRLIYGHYLSNLSPGSHSIVWDGTDGSGKAVSSGVYLYKIESNGLSATKKMLMLK